MDTASSAASVPIFYGIQRAEAAAHLHGQARGGGVAVRCHRHDVGNAVGRCVLLVKPIGVHDAHSHFAGGYRIVAHVLDALVEAFGRFLLVEHKLQLLIRLADLGFQR